MAKTRKNAVNRDETARIVADIHGVSANYVQKVRRGERDNDEIMATLIEYQTGKSKLIKTLERMVPLTPNPAKYARKKD